MGSFHLAQGWLDQDSSMDPQADRGGQGTRYRHHSVLHLQGCGDGSSFSYRGEEDLDTSASCSSSSLLFNSPTARMEFSRKTLREDKGFFFLLLPITLNAHLH
mmetsp:Transcript_25119/g.56709  ORF Transcript_25119/g.56709 Transcript_25119/m.56709 type:complete len:103 (-) Transcript_25119:6-314(-)